MTFFRPLSRIYLTRIRQIIPEKTVRQYTGKTLLEMDEMRPDGFRCLLLRRYDVQIEHAASSVVNTLMIDLGESLYPIELNVHPDGKIRKIVNFEEIRKRRMDKAAELLNHFPTMNFRKYIEMAQENLIDEKALQKALLRDSFIQLFLSCASGYPFCYTCDNFPQKGLKSSYYCNIEKKETNTFVYVARPAFSYPSYKVMEGNIVSEVSAEGSLSGIKAGFTLLGKGGKAYKREIDISVLDKGSTTTRNNTNL
ncbi:hypothetical protein HQ40_03840 [Porphyromonas gulae]|uniref:Uncharacterized protein n=2 Tax=Porphyromonas gulae TaxID=111105 RepID=A0A0A2GKR9_9PORP|nr:hypothetical protein HR09_03720 [Porphyromonas gulae]KGN76260.1 hypothetical protein HQ40_03840 [Porphyromonas gulae]KGN86450.1 hypothetical protein HR15_07930 [Porphyromonas gulae]KGO02971.1 hypothetical protein HQ42_04115 [Porphyromonas gulae]